MMPETFEAKVKPDRIEIAKEKVNHLTEE